MVKVWGSIFALSGEGYVQINIWIMIQIHPSKKDIIYIK